MALKFMHDLSKDYDDTSVQIETAISTIPVDVQQTRIFTTTTGANKIFYEGELVGIKTDGTAEKLTSSNFSTVIGKVIMLGEVREFGGNAPKISDATSEAKQIQCLTIGEVYIEKIAIDETLTAVKVENALRGTIQFTKPSTEINIIG